MSILTGDWAHAKRVLGSSQHLQQAISSALRKEAETFRKAVRAGIESQSPGGETFQPISGWTKASRRFRGIRGNRALIASRELIDSIKVHVTSTSSPPMSFFVGITPNEMRSNGRTMLSVALMNENGAEINIDLRAMTDEKRRKMLAFIAMALRELGITETIERWQRRLDAHISGGSQIIHIKIPARPFIGPIAKDYLANMDVAAKIVSARVAQSLFKVFNPR